MNSFQIPHLALVQAMTSLMPTNAAGHGRMAHADAPAAPRRRWRLFSRSGA